MKEIIICTPKIESQFYLKLCQKIDGFDQCDAHAQILQVDHNLDTEEMPYVLKDVVNPRSKPRKSFVLFQPFRAKNCKSFLIDAINHLLFINVSKYQGGLKLSMLRHIVNAF